MNTITNLWQMNRGQSCAISGYDQKLESAHRQRLLELGFRPGVSVTCTTSPRLGAPKLYRVASAVYSLERQIAQWVLVEENRS